MTTANTLYTLLGIAPDASGETIDDAFRAREQELQGQSDELSLLRVAYDTLRNPAQRSAYDRKLATDELAQLRYEASIRPGFHESFAAMFPAPRQRWVDAMCSAEADIRALPHETLVLHGREDQVIPLANSLKLAEWIPNSQLHVFGHCGHWTQIEHAARFNRLVADFLAEADALG